MKKELTYLTPYHSVFEKNFLAVREKEQRLYSDNTVTKLPIVDKTHSQYKEWDLRAKTTSRFIDYLKNKSFKNVLDIGSGNGWFSNAIATAIDGQVLGLDVNKEELKQANRVFSNSQLTFAYGDVFKSEFNQQFDLIVLNASIQYFPDLERLITRLKKLLIQNGEIHILDSPFYEDKDTSINAQVRTKLYYKSIGFPKMAEFYFHHEIKELNQFDVLYSPTVNKLKRLLTKADSPFAWYRFIKV